jgi:hypothetical protein
LDIERFAAVPLLLELTDQAGTRGMARVQKQ